MAANRYTIKFDNMKKPLIKNYCQPSWLGKEFVHVNWKGYAKEATRYIEYLEKKIDKLTNKNK